MAVCSQKVSSFLKRAAMVAVGLAAVFAAGGARAALPLEYVQLKYITASGTQCIDTGLVVNQTDDVSYQLDACLTNNAVYGGANGYLQFQASIGKGVRHLIKIELKDKWEKIYLDDSTTPASSSNLSNWSYSNIKIGILRMGNVNNSWGSNSCQSGDLYSFKLYKDGELVRDFVPCREVGGAKRVGVYDLQTKAFFANAGSGAFVAGPDEDFPDRLTVTGKPIEGGTVTPAYGVNEGYSAGETFTCSASASWTNDADGVSGACAGYRIYTNNVLHASGADNSFSYTHPDCPTGANLEWQWNLSYKVTSVAGVTVSSNWVAKGATVKLTATPPAGKTVFKWTDTVSGRTYTGNPLNVLVIAPMNLQPTYGKTLTVGPWGADYPDVLSAVAAAKEEIAGGETAVTISVAQGEYPLTAQIDLDGPIAIIGAGAGKTILKRDTSVSSMRIAYLHHADALIEKATIRDGYWNSETSAAGVRIEAGTVCDCEIVNCKSRTWGSQYGVCVVVTGADSRLLRCKLYGNGGSNYHGQALYLTGEAVADSCLIYGNESTQSAAYSVVYVKNATLRNCTVTDNYLASYTAVYVENDTNTHVIDCIVCDNRGKTKTTSYNRGNGFDLRGKDNAALGTCVNLVTYTPGFTNPDTHNFVLWPSSPAIDKGSNVVASVTAVDITGVTPRLCDEAIDPGAYETARGSTPACHFLCTDRENLEGEAFTLDLYNYNGGDDCTYTIDWGDETVEQVQGTTASHAYTTAGIYEVKMSIAGSAVYTWPDFLTVKPKYLYVAKGKTSEPPYNTPDKATPNIEDAVDAASNGSIIYVAPDATPYKFSKKARLSINKDIKVIGQTDDPTRVVFEPQTTGASCLFSLDHASSGLYNLTLQGAKGGGDYLNGDCVYITGNGGTVSNCVMRNVNDGGWGHAACGVYMAAGLVTHCVLSNLTGRMYNSAAPGMAAHVAGGSMENCLIAQNVDTYGKSSASQGGVVGLSGSGRLMNCTIAGNKMVANSGVYLQSTTAKVINCVIGNNTSTTLASETAPVYTGYSSNGKAIVVSNCFTACAAEIKINKTCYGGNLAFADQAKHDYHLTVSSPARDHGVVPDGYTLPATDLDRATRVINDVVDIGCYELEVTGVAVAISSSATVGMTPCSVTFTATVEGADPTKVDYHWDVFGDGSKVITNNTPNFVYQYTTNGNFTVKLTVVKDNVEYPSVNTVSFRGYPSVLYVSKTGSNTAPYDTPEKAAAAVDDAFGEASDGSVVLVAPADTPYPFAKAAQVAIRKNIQIWGQTDDPTRVVIEPKTTGASCLFLLDHADSGLFNLTLQGAKGGGSYLNGDCVYITGLGGTVSNCVMRNVYDNNWGHAACGVYMAAGLVTHCVLTNLTGSMDNPAAPGMAAHIAGGSMENCLIAQNVSSLGGTTAADGGVVGLSGSGRLLNCTVAGNRMLANSGVYLQSTTAKVINCVIGNNTSTTLISETAPVYAGYKSDKTAIDVTNCFTACAAEIKINNTCYGGNLAFADPVQHDYHLTVGSPARDHGVVPDGYTLPATDLDRNSRVVNDVVDIGCYELEVSGVSVAISSSATIGMTPCSVTFTATVEGADPNQVTYNWDVYGDGSKIVTTNIASFVYQYTTNGIFTVKLTVVKDGTNYPAVNTLSFNAYPPILYVSKTGSNTAPYDTPAKAAATVDDAFASASDGSVILVAPAETPYPFAKAAQVAIRKNIQIWGQTDDPTRVVIEPKTTGASCLFLLDHAASGLYNLTLQGAKGGGDFLNGDCVYITGNGGTVSNCVMRNVNDDGWGHAAVGVYMAAGLVTHCVLSNLTGNVLTESAPGMAAYVAGGSMENCLIAQNVSTLGDAVSYRGGVVGMGGTARLMNCTIAGNRMRSNSGIYLQSTTAKVINCVIGNNTSTDITGETVTTYVGYDSQGNALIVTNCFTACATEIDINNTCYKGNLGFVDAVNHDYHLTVGSTSARDHGVVPSDYTLPATDLDRNPRVVNEEIDIGCYELELSGVSVSIASSATKGMTPFQVTFTATVEGADPEELTYQWDVFGDGSKVIENNTPSLVYEYVTNGSFTVKLNVVKEGTSYPAINTVPFYGYPANLYVNGENASPEAPYDTPAKAATTIAAAIAEADEGSVVHVMPGTYAVPSAVSVAKAVRVVGTTGNPADVVVVPANNNWRGFYLQNAHAMVGNLTIQGFTTTGEGGHGVRIDNLGGTVSNCVIRECRASDWTQGSAVYMTGPGLVTHCVIADCRASSYHESCSTLAVSAGSVRNCLIIRNFNDASGDADSGVVAMSGGTIENCTLAQNTNRVCAGIYCTGNGKAYNCVVAEGVVTLSGRPATAAAWSGTAANFENCVVDVDVPNAKCKTDAAPFKDSAAGDFRLGPKSKALRFGAYRPWMPGATDLKGCPRVTGKHVNAGCYENGVHGFTVIIR